MKQLQNNFTTPEQSERLLELGVPRWSSDDYRDEKGYRHSLDGILDIELFFQNFNEYLPCWSVGRLMEITFECDKRKVNIKYKDIVPCKGTIIERMIDILKYAIKCNDIDFSKLEK